MARTGVTGDFKKLDAFARRIESAAGKQGLAELADVLAEEALDLVAEGFRRERDPYGARWARKKRPDGRQVLVGRTARLRRGWHRKESSATGFRIGASVDYASHHQGGTRRMVPRKMVPDAGRLPSLWSRHLKLAAQDYMADRFGG